ncbi:DNA metabolism protein [bacterium]|nr:DNA metabolism protein [bacterium]
MQAVTLAQPDFKHWREAARVLLAADCPPASVSWQLHGQSADLFGATQAGQSTASQHANPQPVPKEFMTLAKTAACIRDESVWPLLYRVLWRLTHGERHLLADSLDSDMLRLRRWASAVRRDVHKMHAFVRFRCVGNQGTEHYIAWFEPTHRIVARASRFFVERYANQQWSILTPDACAHWNGSALQFTAGMALADAPRDDALEDLWRTYFASIFNPARLKPGMMRSEMPEKYWKNLPEARLIGALERGSGAQLQTMVDQAGNAPQHNRKRAAQLPQIKRALGEDTAC